MRNVYIIEGWFGNNEWVEGIYESEEVAQEKCNQLWIKRVSEVLPPTHYVQGLCKFAVVKHEVKDNAD